MQTGIWSVYTEFNNDGTQCTDYYSGMTLTQDGATVTIEVGDSFKATGTLTGNAWNATLMRSGEPDGSITGTFDGGPPFTRLDITGGNDGVDDLTGGEGLYAPDWTSLEKSEWQITLTFAGGTFEVTAEFMQTATFLGGTSRDNDAELDVETSGMVSLSLVDVQFDLSNGGSDRGKFTCSGTISSGSPQTISGDFFTSNGASFGGPAGNLEGTFTMQ